jgi:hypothetical protein
MADRWCPIPSVEQARDYGELGERPATVWADRVIAYCWPEGVTVAPTDPD